MNRRARTWGLDVVTERVPGGIVLVLKGRIGSVTAPGFHHALRTALAEASQVVLDLSGVDYISGEGVRAIQQAGVISGTRTILCGLHDAVRITLELGGALDRTAVVGTRQEAVQSL